MTSARTTFLSGIACLFSILALVAAMLSFVPLMDFALRIASKHSYAKNIQKTAKNNTNEILLVL